jgi:hypothetical protein
MVSHPDRFAVRLIDDDPFVTFSFFSLVCSIHDITAADLPTDIKQSLKHLAHNVAGSVICELGKHSRVLANLWQDR